jgi:hypothetical protein
VAPNTLGRYYMADTMAKVKSSGAEADGAEAAAEADHNAPTGTKRSRSTTLADYWQRQHMGSTSHGVWHRTRQQSSRPGLGNNPLLHGKSNGPQGGNDSAGKATHTSRSHWCLMRSHTQHIASNRLSSMYRNSPCMKASSKHERWKEAVHAAGKCPPSISPCSHAQGERSHRSRYQTGQGLTASSSWRHTCSRHADCSGEGG